MDKICESNNDCADNENCDPLIGICVCSNGFQLDNSKKFCLSIVSNVGLGLNISSYDIDDVNNIIPEQQQIDNFKKVNKNILVLILS